ncbi:MAG: AAA family ATPase [Bradymonadaceae bacterium]
MNLQRIHISGYRSLRDFRLDLGQLMVVVGPNGSGKSNIYNGLALLAAAAVDGAFARRIAEEGGMASAMWAGPRRRNERATIMIDARLEDISYELVAGLEPPTQGYDYIDTHSEPEQQVSRFKLDPVIKEERIRPSDAARSSALFERRGPAIFARDEEGRRQNWSLSVPDWETGLATLRDPERFPVLHVIREELRAWRFYHHFRTDRHAAVRQPQIATRTPILSHDGHDLAAAVQTIIEHGDAEHLQRTIMAAFDGAHVGVESAAATHLELKIHRPQIRRPFAAHELSDGQLKFLCLAAALLSPRPPSFMVLNEPEGSLHQDLIGPLAELVLGAAEHSQIVVTTHSQVLADALSKTSVIKRVELVLEGGETKVKV